MAPNFTHLQSLVRDLRWNFPAQSAGKPVVILLHGLGGDRNDWMDPFQDRNWPYDHKRSPAERDMGVHSGPPVAKLPGLETIHFLSPRMESNSRGADGSDDRSWWQTLVKAGFPVVTYSQKPELMVPFTQGPVAEVLRFMERLQQDVLSDPAYSRRPVVILGHSRGGLIGRAFLGHPAYKTASAKTYPKIKGLITLSSPHQGSHMALMDDKIIGFLSKLQKTVPTLPNDVGNQVIETLKKKVNNYVGPFGDEIEPGSPLFRLLEAQEPLPPGVRCLSVGGTSPRFLRLYLWTYTASSLMPQKRPDGKIEFRWVAKAVEVKGASPIPDGLPLKVLGMDLDEVMPGRGDGLTADKRCQFPPTIKSEGHLSVALSHAEELWDAGLQAEILKRLATFA